MERQRGFEVVTAYYGKEINIPERKTAKSAGYDIEAGDDFVIPPGEFRLIPTGLKAYMLGNEYLAIHVRSSVGIKKSLMLANTTGIVDQDYYNNEDNEGLIYVPLYNYGMETQIINKGERIAQAIFTKYAITDDDNASGKRVGGMGSTGK